MFKIAILGCENSHADNFLTLIRDGKYPDVQVVGVYSDDNEALSRLCGEFGVYGASRPDEFVGKIDGLVVTARHGNDHLRFARPYIESGIPMFIDKPITASIDEAVELALLLKKHGIRYTGGSSCIHAPEVKELRETVGSAERGGIIGGRVRAPISIENIYGNLWFYSQHLVQIMQSVFGMDVKAVSARRTGSCISADFEYENFTVSGLYTDGAYSYFAAVDFADGTVCRDVTVDNKIFAAEFEEFYRLLNGGTVKQSLSDFISPVYVLDAFIRAVDSGKRELVKSIPCEVL